MSFILRLFFPRTTLASEQAEELRFYRDQTAKLIDAVVQARGQRPVFSEPKVPEVKAVSLPQPDDGWREEAEMVAMEMSINEAVGDQEAYADLLDLAESGDRQAAKILDEADVRIRAMQALIGGVQ